MSHFYLTIDDAPTKYTAEKLDFLDKYGIKAIWFCVGEYIENNRNIALSAIKRGYKIGNHSYSHNRFSEMTMETAQEEIQKTEKIIQELYKEACISNYAKLFRFPYGDKEIVNPGFLR